jgi:hypothetical protein
MSTTTVSPLQAARPSASDALLVAALHPPPLLNCNHETGGTRTFGGPRVRVPFKFRGTSLRSGGAAVGWLKNDTLVLSVDITVKRESRFQLEAGPFFFFCAGHSNPR